MAVPPGMGVINLSITTTLNMIQDLNTYWKTLLSAVTGPVFSAIALTDTVITVTGISGVLVAPAANTASQNANFYYPKPVSSMVSITVNRTILVDGEEMIVTAIAAPDSIGNVALTVSRGTTPVDSNGITVSFPSAVPAAHAAGSLVAILANGSPWAMVTNLWLLPGAASAVQALGLRSSMFTNSSAGTVSFS